MAPECAELHSRLDSRVDNGPGHPPVLWCYQIPAATYDCASYYATRASDGRFRLCAPDANNDGYCEQGALVDPCYHPSPPPSPPSAPPAAPPAAPITCPAGATSDSLDGLGPTFYYAGTTTHLEDLPGTGATLVFESIEFQCWCGAGLLYELQVDDGTTGVWATVRQCQVTGNVGLGNCPEMPSLANPLTTSYDPASSWRLRVTNPQLCANNRLNKLNTAYCFDATRRRQLSFLERLFGNGDLDTRSAHTLRSGNLERF